MNTVTVSFLIITSRNFLSQRQSCRSLFLPNKKNEAFRSKKKHLNLPSLLEISVLISGIRKQFGDQVILPLPHGSLWFHVHHDLSIPSWVGGYVLQTTQRERFSTRLPLRVCLGSLLRRWKWPARPPAAGPHCFPRHGYRESPPVHLVSAIAQPLSVFRCNLHSDDKWD